MNDFNLWPLLLAGSTWFIFAGLIWLSSQYNMKYRQKETEHALLNIVWWGMWGTIPTFAICFVDVFIKTDYLIPLAIMYATTFPLTLGLYRYSENRSMDKTSDNFCNELIMKLTFMNDHDKDNLRSMIKDLLNDVQSFD
jgi:hypothetical protein